ncbi:hypothetical protein M885DRAFT_532699 [Pelagophyceae sp. CCMP2097]|nr:hypothetical protein M885DRAFT_532699 [Pelagophyceae sp. CCMP2097]
MQPAGSGRMTQVAEASARPDTAGEDFVLELLDEVCGAAVAAAHDRLLDREAPALAVAFLLRHMRAVVDWDMLRYGPPDAWDDGVGGGAEPETAACDTWARGVVQCKTTESRRDRGAALRMMADGAPPSPESTSSRTSSALLRKARRRAPKALHETGGSAGQPEPIMFSLAEEDDLHGAFSSQEKFRRPAESEKHAGGESEAAAAERRQAEAEAALALKLAALKDKPFTIDDDGTVILIMPPEKAKSASAQTYQVKTLGLSPAGDGQQQRRQKQRRSSMDASDALQQYFLLSPAVQPSLVSGEQAFSVSQGLIVRQGLKSLAGPPPQADPDHLSHAEYEALRGGEDGASLRSGSVASRIDASLDGASLDGGSFAQSFAQSNSGDDRSFSDARSFATGASRRTGAKAFPGHDVDALHGGKPLLASQSLPVLVRPPTGTADENLRLLGAPDWGAVGPLRDPVVGRMHTRQSSRQRARTFTAGAAARARAARVRVAEARPTRKLASWAVPPPGVSAAGLAILQNNGDLNSMSSYGSRTSLTSFRSPASP